MSDTTTALFLNIFATLICFFVLVGTFYEEKTYPHTIAAAVGFLGFMGLSVAVATEVFGTSDLDSC